MEQVVVTSIVRDGMVYLDRYADQVDQLARLLSYRDLELVVMIAENDSRDGTSDWLTHWPAKCKAHVRTFRFPNGGPSFGSVDNPVRWRNIATTWNRLYGELVKGPWFQDDGPGLAAVVYVETDLIWSPATMLALIDDLASAPAVAPMVFLRKTTQFYDIWGYQRDGQHFDWWPPYHPALAAGGSDLVRLDCAASCYAMRPEVARGLAFDPADAMSCRSIYERGFSLWLNPRLRVYHP